MQKLLTQERNVCFAIETISVAIRTKTSFQFYALGNWVWMCDACGCLVGVHAVTAMHIQIICERTSRKCPSTNGNLLRIIFHRFLLSHFFFFFFHNRPTSLCSLEH